MAAMMMMTLELRRQEQGLLNPYHHLLQILCTWMPGTKTAGESCKTTAQHSFAVWHVHVSSLALATAGGVNLCSALT
jgi:hypothetical protein